MMRRDVKDGRSILPDLERICTSSRNLLRYHSRRLGGQWAHTEPEPAMGDGIGASTVTSVEITEMGCRSHEKGEESSTRCGLAGPYAGCNAAGVAGPLA